MTEKETKGWFIIPGVRDGDRTFEEQFTGLEFARDEAVGKTVLDLGCAEGLISIEFAKAGASKVTAVEKEERHIGIAAMLFKDYPQIELVHKDMMDIRGSYDVVLALAVLHKLWEVEAALRRACKLSRSLLVFRWPIWMGEDGILRSKRDSSNSVDVNRFLKERSFVLERDVKGPRNERVQYWRRTNT